eukprot:7090085-Prymnesium_polylepis.1
MASVCMVAAYARGAAACGSVRRASAAWRAAWRAAHWRPPDAGAEVEAATHVVANRRERCRLVRPRDPRRERRSRRSGLPSMKRP